MQVMQAGLLQGLLHDPLRTPLDMLKQARQPGPPGRRADTVIAAVTTRAEDGITVRALQQVEGRTQIGERHRGNITAHDRHPPCPFLEQINKNVQLPLTKIITPLRQIPDGGRQQRPKARRALSRGKGHPDLHRFEPGHPFHRIQQKAPRQFRGLVGPKRRTQARLDLSGQRPFGKDHQRVGRHAGGVAWIRERGKRACRKGRLRSDARPGAWSGLPNSVSRPSGLQHYCQRRRISSPTKPQSHLRSSRSLSTLWRRSRIKTGILEDEHI